jgi:hypothetical protein
MMSTSWEYASNKEKKNVKQGASNSEMSSGFVLSPAYRQAGPLAV